MPYSSVLIAERRMFIQKSHRNIVLAHTDNLFLRTVPISASLEHLEGSEHYTLIASMRCKAFGGPLITSNVGSAVNQLFMHDQ